ncbi:hypothetical protein B296_00026521 [Ensete ventricosum]|uniref:Uncharacterized protein n=1 Tax=Ensete ventricosum TaxID=4639 RepID=A0A426Z0U6_ENSVE|nr:hypothetical protein B296_00026521 [Ensete ventricosum]
MEYHLQGRGKSSALLFFDLLCRRRQQRLQGWKVRATLAAGDGDAKNRVNMVSISGLEALTRRKFLQTSSSNELGVNQYRRWLELICCRYWRQRRLDSTSAISGPYRAVQIEIANLACRNTCHANVGDLVGLRGGQPARAIIWEKRTWRCRERSRSKKRASMIGIQRNGQPFAQEAPREQAS